MKRRAPSRREVPRNAAIVAAAGPALAARPLRAEVARPVTAPHIDAALRTAIGSHEVPGVAAMVANEDGIRRRVRDAPQHTTRQCKSKRSQ